MPDTPSAPGVSDLHPAALRAALDLAGGDARRLRIISRTEVYVLNRPGARLPAPAPATTCTVGHFHGRPCARCRDHEAVRNMLYCPCCAEQLGDNSPACAPEWWHSGRRAGHGVRVRSVVSGGLPTLGKRR